MKIRFFSLFLALGNSALIAGCGGEPPASDLAAAKGALDAARAAGAEKFAASDYTAAQGAYSGAEQAVNTESEKLFKNFDQSKQMIADAKAKADRAKAAAEAEKGRQRSAAKARYLPLQARSKRLAPALMAHLRAGTESDIEQLRSDLNGADADLNAARSAVAVRTLTRLSRVLRVPKARRLRCRAACRRRLRSMRNWSRRCVLMLASKRRNLFC